MKLSSMVFFTLVTLISMTCCADNKSIYKIEGLNDDIYYTLCGVWDSRKIINEEEFEWALFTWGKSEFTQDSTIIDFGYIRTSDMWYDPPAIFRVGEDAVKILSIKMINKREIRFNLEGEFWDVETNWVKRKKGSYTIHINDDDTIWIDYHDTKRKREDFDWSKIRFKKISGPRRPKGM